MTALEDLKDPRYPLQPVGAQSVSTPPMVGLLVGNPQDRALLEQFVAELGYRVTVPLAQADETDISQSIDLLIADRAAVQRYNEQFRYWKRRAGSVFLPILVLLPSNLSGAAWLQSGFDDVLHIPISKGELAARLDVFLRLRTQSKAQYQNVLENALIGIYRLTPDGNVVLANQAMARMLGITSFTQLDRMPFLSLIERCDPERDVFWADVGLQGSVLGVESTWWRRDGRKLTVWESARVVTDDQGEPLYFEGTVEDITERKRIENAVRRSEGRFRALLERSSDVIIVVDVNSIIQPSSPSVEQVLGYSPLEWRNRSVFDFLDPSSESVARREFIRCLENPGVPITAETLVRHQDGSWRTFELVGVNLLGDPDVEGIVINGRDISERKSATRALRSSENRLRALIDGALDAILVADDSGHYVDANPAACELLGVSRDELLRMRVADFGANSGAVDRQFQNFVDEGHQQGVFQMNLADGRVVHIEYRATANFWPGLHLSVLRDVTERTRTEALLRESEERFRVIFDNSAIGIGLLTFDGSLVTCNRAFEQLVGYRESELKEIGVRSITHPDDVPREAALALEIMEGKRRSYQLEKRYIRSDGETVWVRLTISLAHTSIDNEPLIIGMVEDITDRMRAERALRESEERFRAMFDGAAIGIGLMDSSRRFIACNPAMQSMLGYSEQELASLERYEWIHPEDLTGDVAYFEELVSGIRDQFRVEKRYLRRGGQEMWGRMTTSLVRDEMGVPSMIIGMLEDVTDRKQVEQQLVHDAFHDPLTGLPNRALFVDRLDHLLVRGARRSDQIFAVLFLDLDRFKIVNDSLGHLKGDQLLVAIAQRLKTCVRPDDTVARLGGDEFTILLEELHHPADATRVADRIQDALSTPVEIGGVDVYTSGSIGIALSTNGYEQSEHLLRDADAAMYYAKSLGRSRYEIFDTKMHIEAMTRLQLESELRRAIEYGEFTVHYQPIMSLRDDEIGWFEALVRWRHPIRGIVSPDEFIPLAEETGLILAIDRFVLRESCRQMRTWLEGSPNDSRISVSVNLSRKQFNDPHLPEFIESVLNEEGVDGTRLRLEITESMVMGNVEQARRMLTRIHDLGVNVHMDDFGTGYSSLSELHSFALNKLKIDRSFVQRMGESGERSEVVLAVVAIAHSLKLQVIAEGIETAEQLSCLRQMGCDYGQGYFFARPLESDDVAVLMGLPNRA